MSLDICPMTLKEANAFVEQHHRHHKPVVGHKFSIGCTDGEKIVGVAIVGRPVSRHLDDGWTLRIRLLWSRNGLQRTRARRGRACFWSTTQRLLLMTTEYCGFVRLIFLRLTEIATESVSIPKNHAQTVVASFGCRR